MYERKTVHKRWRWPAALCGLILILPLVPGLAVAGTRPLSLRVRAGVVVVRVNWRSELLPALQAIAGTFPGNNKLDVNYDDYACFDRFCDRDAPYHVVVQMGALTDHDKQHEQLRFPAGTAQPEAFLVGNLRIVFVAHNNNPLQSLDFAGIRKALSETGRTARWQDLGGVGSTAVHCCGAAEKTWARQLVQDRCMTRWRDADQPGVRELQRLAYRDDLVSCAGPKEVLAKVRGDRNALGFFACFEPLTKRDLFGVKVLAIAEKKGAAAVAPPLDLASDEAYPLMEPLYLYVHPKAPAVAREFCKFATGAEAAKIVQQFGIWPEYLAEEANSKQRVADAKAGKAAEILVCDLTGCGEVLKDLSLEFAKAKAAVRLKFQKAGTREEAVERLGKGATELLLTDGPVGEVAKEMTNDRTERNRPHPNPLPEGEGTVRPHPNPLPEGEGMSSPRRP